MRGMDASLEDHGSRELERSRRPLTSRRPTSIARPSAYNAEKLLLKNELALLVFLAALVGLVVLPSYRLLALAASDVAYDMSPGGHVTFDGLGLGDVDDVVEKVGFAVLAAETLADNRG